MILRHPAESGRSIGGGPTGPYCPVLEEDWGGSSGGSPPDSPVGPDDPCSPDLTVAAERPRYESRRCPGRSAVADGGASRLATVVVPEPPGAAAGSGADVGSGPIPAVALAGGVEPAAAETRRIGKYLVVELLDGGGQAQVFRVLHPELARELVLKLGRRPIEISRPEESGAGGEGGPKALACPALFREGRLLARCDHPNLVRVVDVGVHDCRPFVVMEYVPGLTLSQHARQSRPGPREAARLVAELAGAVAYLHAQGIVHQDIKPRNALIDERGRPRLIDFGLARWDHAWSGAPGDWFGGTSNYMSPEQALGRPDRIGPWTDVFGLGGVLYYLLTLGPPYRGASRISIDRQAREASYLPVHQLAPATPRGLERIVDRAMAADPERRYRNAAELESALRRFLARRRIAAAVLAIALVASAVALFLARGVPARAGRSQPTEPTVGPAPVPAPVAASSAPRGPEPAASWIRPLRVEAFRGKPTEALGTVGVTARPVRVDDEVEVSARFDAPAYGYLIALDPDGQVQLCQPLEGQEPPPRSEGIRIDESKIYGLTGRPGLQAFVVLASRRPLPPFEQWRGGAGLHRLWRRCASGRAWRFDGRRLEALSAVSRGELKARPGPEAPAPLREVCEYLAKSPEFEAVAAIAFPVEPKE